MLRSLNQKTNFVILLLLSTILIAGLAITPYSGLASAQTNNNTSAQPEASQDMAASTSATTATTTSNNNTNSLNVQDIPLQKVHVGDIDVGYKMFGKGEPIILIQGFGGTMDAWEPSIINDLASNHTVIIFDNRAVGNTTAGTKPLSVQQFANDTVGLLDGLKIQKADVLGYSLGSFIAQQFAVTHPEKVNRLLLVASSCGGKDSIPNSPEDQRFNREILNKITNNAPITREDVRKLMNNSFGSAWLKSHPELLQDVPEQANASELGLITLPLNTYMKFFDIVEAWKSTNWSGVCDELTRVSSPTLIITGTDDGAILPANSLIIAGKIPGAWLVHIKDAGHGVMDQYPTEVSKILNTFLTTTTTAQASSATSTATTAAENR